MDSVTHEPTEEDVKSAKILLWRNVRAFKQSGLLRHGKIADKEVESCCKELCPQFVKHIEGCQEA